MLKYFSFISILLTILLLTSCSALLNTPGFYSGFDKLSEDQKGRICFIDSIQQLEACNNNYKAISGHILYEMLPDKDTTLLILWRPECASDACMPLSTIVDFCVSTNYNYIIVPDFYEVLFNSQIETYNGELYFMNHKYYDSNFNPKVRDRFINDIVSHFNADYNDLMGHRFSFFVGNKQIHTFEYLEDMEKYISTEN